MLKVLVGGCFDILHYGHIVFLQKAKSLADVLIVVLESDQKVSQMKGNGRPLHTQTKRATMLLSLRSVDKVIKLKPIQTYEDYKRMVKRIKPDIIAATSGDPQLKNKQKMAKVIGAKVVIIPFIPSPSTSQIFKTLDV